MFYALIVSFREFRILNNFFFVKVGEAFLCKPNLTRSLVLDGPKKGEEKETVCAILSSLSPCHEK